MRFDVKIDWWMYVLFYGIILMYLPILLIIPQEEYIYMYAAILITAVIMLPFLHFSYYVLEEDHLFIRLGYIHSRIYYKNIKEVRSARSLASSFALSLDQVKIVEHNKNIIFGTTFISPKDKERFIMELQHNCPNLDQEVI